MRRSARATKSLDSDDALESVISQDEEEAERRFAANYELLGDCQRPWISLILNLCCLLVYSYTLYYQNFDPDAKVFFKILEPNIKPYLGLWIFLTYHSLVIQTLSSALHLIAVFYPKCNRARDIVFSCLAYPIGSMVAYSFWIIWFTQGREMIFPEKYEPFYPGWLNHVSHTMLVPINLAQCYLTYHRIVKRGCFIPLAYMNLYGLFTLFFRWQYGRFMYPYLNQMNPVSLAIYWGSNSFCILALYETGLYLSALLHLSKLRRYVE